MPEIPLDKLTSSHIRATVTLEFQGKTGSATSEYTSWLDPDPERESGTEYTLLEFIQFIADTTGRAFDGLGLYVDLAQLADLMLEDDQDDSEG